MTASVTVEFLGTRGAFPLNLPETQWLGTETSAIRVQTGSRCLYLDAGTGLNRVEPSIQDDVILLSHFHYDHVLGLPYFLMRKQTGTVRLISHCAESQADFEKKLESVFGGIGFPVALQEIYADLSLEYLPDHETKQVNDFEVQACALNHPGGASGYRLTHPESGVVICHLLDHECGTEVDTTLIRFAHNADLIVFDGCYDNTEYACYQGYGHSTIEHGRQFRMDAGAKRVALSGHSMERLDQNAQALGRQLDASCELLARDGLMLELPQ